MSRTLDELAGAMYGTPAAQSPAVQQPATPSPAAAPATGMRTEDELAEAIYGKSPAPASAPGQSSEPAKARNQDELAGAMYGKEAADDTPLVPVPPEVEKLRDDPARRLYSAQTSLRDAISEKDFTPGTIDGKQMNQLVREVREMAADLDFGPKEITALKQRFETVKASAPNVDEQRNAAVDALNREFGQDAAQALRDARALLLRDPRTSAVIDAMGLGDDPEVVLMFARAARSQRATGKLK